jgi:hypothetical protein
VAGAAAAPPPPKPAKKKPIADQPAADSDKGEGGGEQAGDEGDAAPPPPVRRRAKGKTAKASQPEDAESAEDEETDGVPPIALRVGVGGSALFRSLSWHDDHANMSPYQLSPGPEGAAWLEAFPASFMTDGIAAQIGLFGSFDYGFGVTSRTNAGVQLTTKFQDFVAGLKVRIPLGIVAPYISGAYGQQTFRLEQDSGAPVVPGVAYKFVRGGAGVHVTFSRMLVADVDLAFLSVTDPGSQAGDIRSTAFFSRASAYAGEAGLSLGLRLFGPLGLRAGGQIRQYGFDFHSQPTDPRQVGGAVDRYITIWGGVEATFDGYD